MITGVFTKIESHTGLFDDDNESYREDTKVDDDVKRGLAMDLLESLTPDEMLSVVESGIIAQFGSDFYEALIRSLE